MNILFIIIGSLIGLAILGTMFEFCITFIITLVTFFYTTFQGKLTRSQYWIRLLAFSIIGYTLLSWIQYQPILWIPLIISIIYWYSVVLRRLDDMGWNKWITIFVLIPSMPTPIMLAIWIILGCVKSKTTTMVLQNVNSQSREN